MMRKKVFPPIILTLAIVVIQSCNEIYIENIENYKVVLIAPTDSIHTHISSQTFVWNEVEGATRYVFQLVTPSFDSIKKIVYNIDTIKTTISLYLNPGKYQWRVKAYNSVYETSYTIFTLYIDSSYNISNEIIQLFSPLDSTFSNKSQHMFSWLSIYNAKKYIIEVFKNEPYESLYFIDTVLSNKITISLNEGKYFWHVKALNQTSSTNYSNFYSIYIDLTSPEAPILSLPSNNFKAKSDTVVFKWLNSEIENGGVDSFYLFSPDQKIIYKSICNTNEKTLIYNTSDTLYYYWGIKTVDRAGNVSPLSEKRSIRFKN